MVSRRLHGHPHTSGPAPGATCALVEPCLTRTHQDLPSPRTHASRRRVRTADAFVVQCQCVMIDDGNVYFWPTHQSPCSLHLNSCTDELVSLAPLDDWHWCGFFATCICVAMVDDLQSSEEVGTTGIRYAMRCAHCLCVGSAGVSSYRRLHSSLRERLTLLSERYVVLWAVTCSTPLLVLTWRGCAVYRSQHQRQIIRREACTRLDKRCV